MIRLVFFVVAWCALGVLRAEDISGEPYTFRSDDGRELRGLIIEKSAASVRVLRADNGQEVAVPLWKLSAEDQEFVKVWQKPVGDEVGAKVVSFARDNIGKQVGKGECAHLATEAIKAVGAARRPKDSPGSGDYVWGDLIAFIPAGSTLPALENEGAKIKPGDIIQFRDARFKGKKAKRGTYWKSASHHTAVVEWVDPADGGKLHVLHQNTNGVRSVVRGFYKIADFKKGWIRIYRPVIAPQ